jgi:hypothetical protein
VKDMKKILVVLLVVGLLVGAISAAVTAEEELSADSLPQWQGDASPDPGASPCGGGGGNGGGAPD